MSYVVDAYKIMKKLVGTTLNFNLFYGGGGGSVVTVYRVERDIKKSFRMIEIAVKNNPGRIVRQMDKYDDLVKKTYKLFLEIRQAKGKIAIKNLLVELDCTFLFTLCYYLYFVYVGYAANLPAIAKLIKIYGKRLAKIRTYTIDTDMVKQYPALFSKLNPRFKSYVSYMSRRELLAAALRGKRFDIRKILDRKKKYLIIIKNNKAKEYRYLEINKLLDKEIAYSETSIPILNRLRGQVACPGVVTGAARIVFTQSDYQKIKNEDILITSMTKPNIVPFLKRVKGIVTNDGGALSHASIISREMKIPCIVGTVHATDIIKTGDLVEVDADKGVVKILKRQDNLTRHSCPRFHEGKLRQESGKKCSQGFWMPACAGMTDFIPCLSWENKLK